MTTICGVILAVAEAAPTGRLLGQIYSSRPDPLSEVHGETRPPRGRHGKMLPARSDSLAGELAVCGEV